MSGWPTTPPEPQPCARQEYPWPTSAGHTGRSSPVAAHRGQPVDRGPRDQDAPAHTNQADLNEIVAYNFRAARELRGWTQDETAEPSKASSASASPKPASPPSSGPTRETAAGSSMPTKSSPSPSPLAFDLPLIWFFLPPPADHRTLHHTTNIVSELYGIVFGQERAVRTRLRPAPPARRRRTHPSRQDHREPHPQTKPGPPNQLPAETQGDAPRTPRPDEVDRAADEIGTFFDHLRQVGVRGLVAEHLRRRRLPQPAGPESQATRPRLTETAGASGHCPWSGQQLQVVRRPPR